MAKPRLGVRHLPQQFNLSVYQWYLRNTQYTIIISLLHFIKPISLLSTSAMRKQHYAAFVYSIQLNFTLYMDIFTLHNWNQSGTNWLMCKSSGSNANQKNFRSVSAACEHSKGGYSSRYITLLCQNSSACRKLFLPLMLLTPLPLSQPHNIWHTS